MSSPFKAFELARRQHNTVDDTIGNKFAADMGMEKQRHELKNAPMLPDAAVEGGRVMLIGGKGDSGDRTATIVNGDSEAATNAKTGCLVKE